MWSWTNGLLKDPASFLMLSSALPPETSATMSCSNLFGKQTDILNWDRRYSIACDVASALVYLHEDWEQRVVHRDVKASNVMLDSDFNGKLGDFGLARLVGRDRAASHKTVVAGTYGYLAPECVYTGKASTESDVFSFGAVALEIACGRPPVDRRLDERLVEWVWDLYGQGRLLDSVDQKLDGNFKADEMERLLLLGLLCSHPDPNARPKMRDVVKILKFEAQLPNVPLNLPVAVYDNPVSRGFASSGISGTSVSCARLCTHHRLLLLLVRAPDSCPNLFYIIQKITPQFKVGR